MSRQEADREDLLREATALVERAEITVPAFCESIVVGFRRDGSLSVFFSGEEVYQFNAAGELRRAFSSGLLYKAERGRLVSLRRERGEAEVALVRTELTDQQSTDFLNAARERLTTLAATLGNRTFSIVGQVPADVDVVSRVQNWLIVLPAQIRVARIARLQ